MLNRSYYAIIPAVVRYDKDLSSTAKLLYAEITALCNDKGFCWATNKYFSDLYEISDRQIQRILKQLCDKNYIKIIIENKVKRKIYILSTYDENVVGGATKMSYLYDKNVAHNNINNNKMNINNNIPDYNWLDDNF